MNDFKKTFLAIGAHADDVELAAGGTMARLSSEGHRVIIADMTEATAATRGTPEQRRKEAENSATLLGVSHRINVGLEDAALQVDSHSVESVIRVIREVRPDFVLTHYMDDYHPDHWITAEIVKQAWYKAGLKSIDTGQEAWRPARIFHFMGPVAFEPTFCVDISSWFDTKMKALLAYESQFYTPQHGEFSGKTAIASPEFMDFVQARNRHWGTRIRSRYAEAFWCREIAEVSSLADLQTGAY